jgi:hypothetical protein
LKLEDAYATMEDGNPANELRSATPERVMDIHLAEGSDVVGSGGAVV